MSKRVHFVMPDDLIARIDAAVPDGVSRGEFVRWAIEQALGEAKEPGIPEQADPGSVPSSAGVRSAAPAEQPEPDEWLKGYQPGDAPLPRLRLRAPSSVQAKRDVRPVPKAKP